MIAHPRTRRFVPLSVIAVIVLLSSVTYFRSLISFTNKPISDSLAVGQSQIEPANATLGFGALYVVSTPGSKRKNTLLQAAAVTELNFTIPEQIEWTDDDVLDFKVNDLSESKITTGSVKAWLSHLRVLRTFLESGLDTALIFEDDVDWDIRLRTQQIPLTQIATRQILKNKQEDTEAYPWGNPLDWDVLYLGHCGDYFNALKEGVGVGHHHPSDLDEIPHVVFQDESVSYFTNLHPFTASLLSALRVPEKTRILHQSKFPLCTFGYAVTRKAAEKILTEVAPPKEELHPDNFAYDNALRDGCRYNKHLRCYSVQPELFHHMEGKSMIASIDENYFEVFRPPVDVQGLEQVQWRNETSNIGCGFFSGDFYYDGNMEKLKYLREEVGRKGQCLKPQRY